MYLRLCSVCVSDAKRSKWLNKTKRCSVPLRLTAICEAYHLHEGFNDLVHTINPNLFSEWIANQESFVLAHEDPQLSYVWCHLIYYYHLGSDVKVVALLFANNDNNNNNNNNDNNKNNPHSDTAKRLPASTTTTTITPTATTSAVCIPVRGAVIELMRHVSREPMAPLLPHNNRVTFSGRTYEEVMHLACLVAAKYHVEPECMASGGVFGSFAQASFRSDWNMLKQDIITPSRHEYSPTALLWRLRQQASLLRFTTNEEDHKSNKDNCLEETKDIAHQKTTRRHNVDERCLHLAHIVDMLTMPDTWRAQLSLQILANMRCLNKWTFVPLAKKLIDCIFEDGAMSKICTRDPACSRWLHLLICRLYSSNKSAKMGGDCLPQNMDALTIEFHERRTEALFSMPIIAPLRLAAAILSNETNGNKNATTAGPAATTVVTVSPRPIITAGPARSETIKTKTLAAALSSEVVSTIDATTPTAPIVPTDSPALGHLARVFVHYRFLYKKLHVLSESDRREMVSRCSAMVPLTPKVKETMTALFAAFASNADNPQLDSLSPSTMASSFSQRVRLSRITTPKKAIHVKNLEDYIDRSTKYCDVCRKYAEKRQLRKWYGKKTNKI